MEKKRERYFDQFEKVSVPADNKRGCRTELRYTGDLYAWEKTEAGLKKEKALWAAAEVLSIIVFLAAATRKTDFNVLPLPQSFVIISIIPFMAEVWGAVHFILAKSPLIHPDFREIRTTVRVGATAHAIFLAAGVLTGFVLLIVRGTMSGTGILVLIGLALSAAISVLILMRYGKLTWRVIPGEKRS